MHGKSIRIADTNNNITEYQASAIAVNLYGNNIAVLYAQSFGIGYGCMNMALGDNYALADLNLSLWSNYLAGAAATQITGFPNRGGNPDRTGICHRKLDLRLLSDRP